MMSSNHNDKKTVTAADALVKLGALCAASEQCEADLRAKMQRWGLCRNDADRVIESLKADGYISEDRYARAFVRDKLAFNGWGPRKIAYGLAQKRIDRQTVVQALGTITCEQWAGALERVLRVKARTVSGREPRQARAALMRFAASRGFDFDMTCRVLDRLDNE